jgi:hypothetical protein
MHFHNYSLEAHREQERLTKQDFEETIVQLELLKQKAYRLGNDSGETSQIIELINKFRKGEILKEAVLKEVTEIIYRKEGAIDTTGTHPNMGGH